MLNSPCVRALGYAIIAGSLLFKLPEIRTRLDQLGAEPAGHTPEAFDQLIRDDISKWGKVVKALGITAD